MTGNGEEEVKHMLVYFMQKGACTIYVSLYELGITTSSYNDIVY